MSKIAINQAEAPQKNGGGAKHRAAGNLHSHVHNNGRSQTPTPQQHIIHLQRTLGNRAVERLWNSGALQAKLNIGPANDKYEQEADRVADQVVSMSEPGPPPSSLGENPMWNSTSFDRGGAPQVSRAPLAHLITPLQRQNDEEELQEKESPEEELQGLSLQRTVANAPAPNDDEEEEGQAKPLQREPQEPEEEVQGKSYALQAKLNIGPANDKYEQEADRVADQVVSMSEPGPPPSSLGENPLWNSTSAGPMGNSTPSGYKAPSVFAGGAPQLSRAPLAHMITPLQRAAINMWGEAEAPFGAEAGGETSPRLTRLSSPFAQKKGIAPANVESAISSSRGGGRPMSASQRSYFEPRFGADLSGVKFHTGTAAAQMSQAINARAFTVGRDVYFGAGQYSPETIQGKHLIAHELTHTIQQTGAAAPKRRAQKKEGAASLASQISSAPKRAQRLPGFIRNKLGEYARHIPGYTLLTVIIGHNPITGRAVPSTAENLMEGILGLIPLGTMLFDKLKELGIIGRTISMVREGLRRHDISLQRLERTIEDAWEDVSLIRGFDYNMGVLRRHFGLLVSDVTTFAQTVAARVLGMIKETLLNALENFAARVPGYKLLCVILKKDPFTGQAVPRTALNFIGGFMDLIPGGSEKFANLQRSGAIERALAWLNGQIARLNISWALIRQTFTQIWNSFSIRDLANPLGAFERVVNTVRAPVGRIVNFAAAVGMKVLEFIFEGVLGPTGARVLNILKRGRDTFTTIIQNPGRFFGNLIGAAVRGFRQFSRNILQHLQSALIQWLFGAMEGAGIQMPQRFDLAGVVNIVLQILGLTYSQLRPRLVRLVGERAVSVLETTFDFVVQLVSEGPIVIWRKIEEFAGNLRDRVVEGIRNFVIGRVVRAAVEKLATMWNPVGAAIQAIMGIYNTIMFFIERINQILALVESIIGSISAIAAGNLARAANFVERSMARALPVMIGFFARLMNLGNISQHIRNIIDTIRAPVNRALDRVTEWLAAQARRLVGAGRNVVGRVVNWWRQRKEFRTRGGQVHTLYFEGEGRRARLMMGSDPQYYVAHIQSLQVPDNKREIKGRALARAREIDTLIVASTDQSPPNAAQLTAKLNELSVFTADLMEPAGSGAFNPSYGSLTASGFGTSIRVPTLSNNGNGSGVNQGYVNRNNVFLTMKARRRGEGSYYVAGHLLNNNLGGRGDDWRNLTPLTQYANTRDHEPNFESAAKDAVITKGKTVDFIVNAVYGSHAGLATSKVAELRATGDTVKADVIEAEAKAPTSLDCSVIEVSPDRGRLIKRHTVRNTIDTNIDHYDLEGVPAQTVYISEMDKPDLMTLDGVDAAMAQRIMEVRAEVRRWNQLEAQVPGFNKEVVRATSGKNVLLYKVT